MTSEQKIATRLAEKHKLSVSEVSLVTKSIFAFVKETIESGERRPIRIHKLGLFAVKPEREKKLQQKGLL